MPKLVKIDRSNDPWYYIGWGIIILVVGAVATAVAIVAVIAVIVVLALVVSYAIDFYRWSPHGATLTGCILVVIVGLTLLARLTRVKKEGADDDGT